jgi:hypothetical protein
MPSVFELCFTLLTCLRAFETRSSGSNTISSVTSATTPGTALKKSVSGKQFLLYWEWIIVVAVAIVAVYLISFGWCACLEFSHHIPTSQVCIECITSVGDPTAE